jgi:tetratricopeptide (TPR) repeat protein
LKTEMGRGTASYRAPELLRIDTFDESVDIWALGCVLFELVSGQRAFSDDWYVQVYARQNQKLAVQLEAFVDATSRIPLTNLVHEMLELRPDRRPRASHLRLLFEILHEQGSFDLRSEETSILYSRICQTQGQTYSGPSRSIIFSVPYERNPFFTGRDEFLKMLSRELRDVQPRRYNFRIAVYGLGGVGKTQSALEYAYRYREHYAYIFWISGVDRAELFSGFGRIARLLRCGLSLSRPEDIAKRTQLWLEANENWLLIVDNLGDVDVISGYLPQSQGSGHTIITTRSTNTHGICATGLEMREMDRDNAVLFLLGRIQIQDPSMEVREEAYKIIDVLGGLPLAIEQAAGYIKAPENIWSYRRIFQNFRRQLLARQLIGNYPGTVETTWQLSFAWLEKRCPNARSWLQYFAFMNPDKILVDYLRAGAEALPLVLRELIEDPIEWGEVIDALEESSLIRISARDTKFSIHRLLQAVIQDELDSSARAEIEAVLIEIGLKSFPRLGEDRKGINIGRRFRSQVVACLEHTKPNSLTWAELAERLAVFLVLEGIYVEACHWWRVALALRQKLFGEEQADTLRCKIELAKSLDAEGRSQDALRLNKEALAIQKMVLGRDHPDTLVSMSNLAISYDNLGRFREAANSNSEILDLRTRILGPEHPHTLTSMGNLAISYGNLGQFKEASDLDAKTLNLRKKILGPEHPDTLKSMSSLAVSFDNLGQFKVAGALNAEILNLRERILGPKHPHTLGSMGNLAISFGNLGRFKEAANLNAVLLNLRKSILGPEHPETLMTLGNLAVSLGNLGQFKEAADLDAETLNLRKRILGAEHPEALKSMSSLAVSFDNLGRFKEARALNAEILNLRKRILGPEHPYTLGSMSNLAISLGNLGQFKEAANLNAELLNLRKRILGSDHPATLMSMGNLAISLGNLGRFKQATDLHAKTLYLKKKVLGPEHPETLTSMSNLAVSFAKLHQYKMARDLHAETLNLRTRVLGAGHPMTLESRQYLEVEKERLDQRLECTTQ